MESNRCKVVPSWGLLAISAKPQPSAGSLRKQEYSRISKVPQRCHRLPLEWPLRRFAAFAISSLSIGRLPPDFTPSLVTSYSTSVPILEVIRTLLLKSRFCPDTFGNHCTKSYLNSHLFCWLVALKLLGRFSWFFYIYRPSSDIFVTTGRFTSCSSSLNYPRKKRKSQRIENKDEIDPSLKPNSNVNYCRRHSTGTLVRELSKSARFQWKSAIL